MQTYVIRRASQRPALDGAWDGPDWSGADTVPINQFRPESSAHRPVAEARMLYNEDCLFGIFRVEDRYVRAVQTEPGSGVCTDSCVEFFFSPDLSRGYLNLEVNCGGTLLCSHVRDPSRDPGGPLRDALDISVETAAAVEIWHSLPTRVEPEIQDPVTWLLAFAFPIALVDKYVGPVSAPAGRQWRGNFYKCAEHTSHPHWGTWCPVPELNFHLPGSFGRLAFEA